MSLKYKSIYTTITKFLNTILGFVVQFFLTPFILNGLGKELYGVFVIINKIQGYVMMVDLRPTAILRFKLASKQTQDNIQEKREYIGASIIITLILFPFINLIGWILSLCFEQFFEINESHVEIGKYSILLMSFLISIKGFLGLPEAIVRGNNSEYKLFFVESFRMIIYAFLVWLSLSLGFGLIGVIVAIFLTAIFDFILKSIIRRKLYPMLNSSRPRKSIIKEFASNGSWFMISSFGYQILSSADVLIIGITTGSSAVATYSLSKMMLVRISESIGDILGSITASIGHLISEGNIKKLQEIRYKVFRFNLLIGGFLVLYFITFNSSFVSLWVSSDNFIGYKLNFVLCFLAILTLKCFSNEMFINSFQLFKEKSKIISFVTLLYIIPAYFLSQEHGISAIVFTLVLIKFTQLVLYEFLLNNYIRIDFFFLMKNNYKIILLMIIVLIFSLSYLNFQIQTWYIFILYSLLFVIIYTLVAYIFILSSEEKNLISNFISKKINQIK